MALDIEKEITALRKLPDFGQWVEQALSRIQDAVNGLGKNIAADPTGTLPAPPQVQAVDVKASGGLVHVRITDNNPIQKGINYFVEHDTNPAFLSPQVVHLNASRQTALYLPAMDDNGNPQPIYVRAYSQYRGSDPSAPVHFGGSNPTPVNPGGAIQMTLLSSTGSGTAQSTGQEGGSGLGKVLLRPAVGPKRNSA